MTNYRFWNNSDPQNPLFLIYLDMDQWQRPQLGTQLTLPTVSGDKVWKVTSLIPNTNPPDSLVDYFLEPVVYDPSIDPNYILDGYENS